MEDAVSQDARNEAVQRHKRSQVLYGAMTPWWYACAWSPCPPLWRLTQPPPAAQNLPQSHHGSRGNPRSNDRMHPLSRAVAPISHTCAACWAWRRLKPELTSAGVLPTCISSSHGGDSSRPVFLQTGKSQAHMRVSLRTVAQHCSHTGADTLLHTGKYTPGQTKLAVDAASGTNPAHLNTDLRRRPSSAMVPVPLPCLSFTVSFLLGLVACKNAKFNLNQSQKKLGTPQLYLLLF